MRNCFKLLSGLALLCQAQFLQSQYGQFIIPEFHYKMGTPSGDLSKRYGQHLGIGGSLGFQPFNNSLCFGVGASYFFGNTLKEDVLTPFRTSFNGQLIGSDQYLAELKLRERALLIQGFVSLLLPLFSQEHVQQGLRFQLGAGYLEHKIRFVDDARALPQFTSDFKKGLDRLCNGIALIPSISYESLSRKGRLSYAAGIEALFGFTESRRSLNYDTGLSDLGIARNDIMINLKIAIFLPFYNSAQPEEIEY